MKEFEKKMIDSIKEVCPIAWQMWKDKRGWYLPGEHNYNLQVWIYDEFAMISPQGYGSSQSLIAITVEEMKECVAMWWRNRKLVTQ